MNGVAVGDGLGLGLGEGDGLPLGLGIGMVTGIMLAPVNIAIDAMGSLVLFGDK